MKLLSFELIFVFMFTSSILQLVASSDSLTNCTSAPNLCPIGNLNYQCFCCDSTMFTGVTPINTMANSPCVTPPFNAFFAVNLSDPFNTILPCRFVSGNQTGVDNCQESGFLYNVAANDSQWASHPDPCAYNKTITGVTIGDTMADPICMLMGGAVDFAAMQKTYWFSVVDTFSLYQIRNTLRGGDSSTYWDCASRIAFSYGQGINSTPKRRFGYDPVGTANGYCYMVVPFWTLIITAERGVVTSLSWDDDCSQCDSTHCIDGNCAVDIVNCDYYGGATNCDIKVYVAWRGTDSEGSDGNYFTSDESTLSRFRQWSIAGAFTSATNFLPGSLPTIDTESGHSVVGSNPTKT